MNDLNKNVIVAGHICLDITPVFPEKKVENLDELLKPGKLINMNEADVHTGGAVANTGLAMKILGANVELVGKVGNDAFGTIVRNVLKEYHADQGMLVNENDSTSYSVILAIPGIDRIFLHNPGANDTFRFSDVEDKPLDEVALFHFGYPPLMKKMYEDDGEELLKMMKHMKEAGVATSLDMASVDPNSAAGQADWELILEKVLPYVDFFVPSIEELCFMLDKERFYEWQKRAAGKDITEVLDIEKDVKPLAEQCMEFGTKVLLIKCGKPGLYYCTASREQIREIGKKIDLDESEWANKEGFEKSYVPDAVLSGTGAGDTTIAAFLTAILEGYSLERSVQLATATGASCVAAYDALSGLKTFEELGIKIDAGWEKNE